MTQRSFLSNFVRQLAIPRRMAQLPPDIDPRSTLPVTHPDYLYPESRNPYFKKVTQFGKLSHSDHASEILRGRWREDGFMEPQTGRELHVEIGCNAGHVTTAWAQANPGAAYLGIDYKVKAITRAAEKTQKRKLTNLSFIRAHAARMPFIFGPGEIDHLYVFFPDPWAKKSTWKHRFICEENLRALHPLLKKGGTFWIKTDHAEYFEWMVEHLKRVEDLWKITELTRDLHESNPDPISLEIPEVTLFEKLFIRDRIPIKSVRLISH